MIYRTLAAGKLSPMAAASASDAPIAPKPRWYVPTPGKFLFAVLAIQGVLFLSSHYDWFWFNQHKGYTVVATIATTSLILLLLVAWQLLNRLFGLKSQFSLASLLLMIVVIAIPCGWFTHEVALTKRRRDALKAIKCNSSYNHAVPKIPMPSGLHMQVRKGLEKVLGDDFFVDQVEVELFDASDDDLKTIGSLIHISGLVLNGGKITDAGLAHLRRLRGLKHITVEGSEITDAGLAHLREMTGMKHLSFNHTKLTDAGLKHLAGFRQLERLGLAGTQVTDEGLKDVSGCAQLKFLSLRGTKTTDSGLEYLKGLTQLEILILGDTQVTSVESLKGCEHLTTLLLDRTQVTDAGLEHLRGFTQLKDLSLKGTRVTDAGTDYLKGFTQLEALDLSSTTITDAGFEQLIGLSLLNRLTLDDTQATMAGVRKLRAALPNLEFDDPFGGPIGVE